MSGCVTRSEFKSNRVRDCDKTESAEMFLILKRVDRNFEMD